MSGTARLAKKSSKASSKRLARSSKSSSASSSKTYATALILLVLIVAAGLFFFRSSATHASHQSPKEVAGEVLGALSAGKQGDFLKHVDIRSFVSRMDSTGVTRRDYANADPARIKELEHVHGDILAEDIFINANIGKKYEILGQKIKDPSATISIKPWIQLGNKLYKSLMMEKEGEEWKVTGLTSPDI